MFDKYVYILPYVCIICDIPVILEETKPKRYLVEVARICTYVRDDVTSASNVNAICVLTQHNPSETQQVMLSYRLFVTISRVECVRNGACM